MRFSDRPLWRSLTVLLGLVAVLIAVPVDTARAASCFPAGGQRMPSAPGASGRFVFNGHGWGHGIGMSQYGAQGAAKLGCSVTDILTTYYPGISVNQAAMPDTIRVGIVPNRPSGPLVTTYDVEVTAGSMTWVLRDIDPDTGAVVPVEVRQSAGTTWQVAVQPDASFVVRDVAISGDDGVVLEGGDGLSALRATIGSATVRLPKEGHTYKRGAFEFFPRRSGEDADGMYVTLQITSTSETSAMDAYLYGLAEMPSSWEPAALQAQAIVGRSYALAQHQAYGGNRSDCRCDLFDSTSSQHYTGYDKEGEATYGQRWVAAVAATSGRIMTSNGRTAVGFYASSHGGHSETNVFVWGGSPVSYLQPVDDSRWDLASGNPNAAWSVGFSAEELQTRLAGVGIDVGAVQSVSLPAPRGVSGRVGDPARGAGGVLVQGTEGSTRLSGDVLRTALGLRSTLVDVVSQVSCLPPDDVDLAELRPVRLSGADRVATAVALSTAHWPGGSDRAVLASAGNFPDALAGGPLAAKLDAPLLLTSPDRLDTAVARELDRLGASHVTILGGSQAVADIVAQDISGRGIEVERFSGSARWETAATAATAVGPSSEGDVLLALGRHPDAGRAWPDAVASGALQAGDSPLPLLLTDPDSLPVDTREALRQLEADGAERVLIVGGASAISPTVEDAVEALGLATERVAGENRYGTSAAAAQAALERGAHPSNLLVARADAYPDALSAAAVAAQSATPLLLVDNCDLARRTATVEWLDQRSILEDVTVVGGLKAVSERVRWQLDLRMSH